MKNNLLYKNNYLLMMINNSLISLPTPLNINMWWNFGSILGVYLMIQIVSGFFLSIHYCPEMYYAFDSVVHIMKDVKFGWLIRMIHMNGASFYFIFMYLHIARGLYYNSFKSYMVWGVGVIILILSMATAFLGYVLPWGQMSFWGATVITNLLSAVPYFGQDLVEWIWGGFSISNATLNRFYSLHFIFPLIIFLMVVLHLFFLHINGSNNPLGLNSDYLKISFHCYFTLKDLMGFIIVLFLNYMVIIQIPYLLGDPDNFVPANSMLTPEHIKPEWYFLFAYSILRAIPNKLGGVIGLFMSLVILLLLPFLMEYKILTNKFYPFQQMTFWVFINCFILLTWIGGKSVDYPYILINQIVTIMYFMYFMFNFYLSFIWDNLIYKY